MTEARVALSLLLLGLVLAGSGKPAASASSRTVLDGVYTPAQMNRGRVVYDRHCRSCHGSDMLGGGQEPPLVSSLFLDVWREDFLASFYDYTATRMPRGRNAKPGSLRPAEYLDIVAYILARNGFPAGSSELRADDLQQVLLVGPDGPAPLPPSAMVRTAGCLEQQQDGWRLAGAGTPVRVREGDTTDAQELALSAAATPGSTAFRLNNLEVLRPLPELAALAGQRVQAKGVLNGSAETARIFVLSLEALGQPCG